MQVVSDNAFSSALGVLFISVFSFMVINREPQDDFFNPIIKPSSTAQWEDLFARRIDDRVGFANKINDELRLTLLFDDIQVYYDLLKFEENDKDFKNLEHRLTQYTELKLWLVERIKEEQGKIFGIHEKIQRHSLIVDDLKQQYNSWRIDSTKLIEIQQQIAKLENEKSWWERDKTEKIQKCNDAKDLIKKLEIQISSIETKISRLRRLDESYDSCIINVEEIENERDTVKDEKDQLVDKLKREKGELDVIDLKILSTNKKLELSRHMVKMCEHFQYVQRQKEEIARDYQSFSSDTTREVDNFNTDDLTRLAQGFQSSHSDYAQNNQAQRLVNQVEDYFSSITDDLQGFENCKLEFNCDIQRCQFYIDQIQILTNELTELKKEKNAKYYQIQLIEGDVKNKENKLYDLERKIKEQQAICNQLVISMRDEGTDPSHIKYQILELKDELTQKRNELESLKQQLRGLDCEHARFPNTDDLADKISYEFKLRRKITETETKINQMCHDCKKEATQLTQRISHFEQTHQELRKREIELENKKNKLELVNAISDCGKIHYHD